MTAVDWVTAGCALVVIVLVAALVRDRTRLRHERDNALGRSTGLQLDLDAARERIADLERHLAHPDTWDATEPRPAPAPLLDPRPVDRWTPAADSGPHVAGPPPSIPPTTPARDAERAVTPERPGSPTG